jgi:hypothetical protein
LGEMVVEDEFVEAVRVWQRLQLTCSSALNDHAVVECEPNEPTGASLRADSLC